MDDLFWPIRHIDHHTTNDNHEDQGAGGLALILGVSRSIARTGR